MTTGTDEPEKVVYKIIITDVRGYTVEEEFLQGGPACEAYSETIESCKREAEVNEECPPYQVELVKVLSSTKI